MAQTQQPKPTRDEQLAHALTHIPRFTIRLVRDEDGVELQRDDCNDQEWLAFGQQERHVDEEGRTSHWEVVEGPQDLADQALEAHRLHLERQAAAQAQADAKRREDAEWERTKELVKLRVVLHELLGLTGIPEFVGHYEGRHIYSLAGQLWSWWSGSHVGHWFPCPECRSPAFNGAVGDLVELGRRLATKQPQEPCSSCNRDRDRREQEEREARWVREQEERDQQQEQARLARLAAGEPEPVLSPAPTTEDRLVEALRDFVTEHLVRDGEAY